ncbi:MAG: Adaptive-response sensory-kinase SasA [Syntrophus sp. SKADARSKE-3]|nr:Adaptive-response sensory-kinase SasA [Syntrophus sp. SKADARSKE-3]
MTVRTRLLIVAILGLSLTMGLWGWAQLEVLDKLLINQQEKRLDELADTVSTYYEHFPTKRGLSALDLTLKDHVQTDTRLARIDLFTVQKGNVEFVAGAGRISYDWPENAVSAVLEKMKPRFFMLNTEAGPAMALLYPDTSEIDKSVHVVGVIAFSHLRAEILSRAKVFLLFSSVGLLLVILFVLYLTFDWLLGRPLTIITRTIDEFQQGRYANRIRLERRDEMGHLADHFNDMADEIEQVLERNIELNRHLSERVQEETLKAVQLQNQVNQLQQLTAMGYLTATLAHDLGTPLHSIAGMAELLLERGGWAPDVARKLELIVQQTQRLNMAIQNIRRVTRPPEPHFEAVAADDLLNETLPLMEPLMQRMGIELCVETSDQVPPLYIDRSRVQTALLNLIQNATEAMENYGQRIMVSVTQDISRRAIAIAIQDDGPGIPSDLMEKICEPFFSTHENEGLRGLGLAIVKDIMKVHSGDVAIESQSGKGTRITLYFPINDTIPN